MNLLNGLQFATLRELIRPLEHQITLPFTDTTDLTAVCIVDTPKNISQNSVIHVLVSQLSACDGLVVLLDCTYSWGAKSHNYTTLKTAVTEQQMEHMVIQYDITNIGSLIKTLRKISTGELFQSEQHQRLPVKCVIIDNVSIFKPETDNEQTTKQEYVTLGHELMKLQAEIGCSLLVKCWDRGFSTGVVKRLSSETTHKNPLSYWSGLPHDFMDIFEHVYYLQRSRDGKVSGQYFQRGAHTAISINNGVMGV